MIEKNENKIINIHDIIKMIPHRYPLLLVDRVIDLEKNKNITGIKNISFNEPQFMGHFPNDPVMPGVLIIEALAQVSAILVSATLNATPNDKIVYFMSINSAKFRKIVRPGDSLILKSKVLQERGNVWKFAAEALVDDKVVTETEFKAMIKDKD